MAKFLDGSGVQSSLTNIIKNADEKLFIISPYLKIPIQTKSYLKSADKKNIPINIIYRSDSKVSDDDLQFFKELSQLRLGSCENLHSKCYLNEKEGLITSMNLHEHSQTHNWEMGIQFSRDQDSEIYNEVIKELTHLISQTQIITLQTKQAEVRDTAYKYTTKKTEPKLAYKPTEAPNKSALLKIIEIVAGEEGFCIRCGTGLKKFDLQKPYCDKCYASWARYKNPKYKEKFCHGCGGMTTTKPATFEKPLCKRCFTKFYKT
jgi:HKD family nuclease